MQTPKTPRHRVTLADGPLIKLESVTLELADGSAVNGFRDEAGHLYHPSYLHRPYQSIAFVSIDGAAAMPMEVADATGSLGLHLRLLKGGPCA